MRLAFPAQQCFFSYLCKQDEIWMEKQNENKWSVLVNSAATAKHLYNLKSNESNPLLFFQTFDEWMSFSKKINQEPNCHLSLKYTKHIHSSHVEDYKKKEKLGIKRIHYLICEQKVWNQWSFKLLKYPAGMVNTKHSGQRRCLLKKKKSALSIDCRFLKGDNLWAVQQAHPAYQSVQHTC